MCATVRRDANAGAANNVTDDGQPVMLERPTLEATAAEATQGTAGGIDVWLTFRADVAETLERDYLELLDAGERARFDRFKVEGSRTEYLVGRALVRTTLSRYGSLAPREWQFETNQYGRPHIAGDRAGDLVFNLSHTRGLAAIAVANGLDIGVDVETVERVSACHDLAGRYFASSEARFVRTASDDALTERFFAFWTLKEAYIKARGMGLALPLDGFAFDLAGSAEPRIAFTPSCPDNPQRWRFWRRAVSAEHRLALAASPSPHGKVRFFRTVPLTDAAIPIEPPDEPLDRTGDSAPEPFA